MRQRNQARKILQTNQGNKSRVTSSNSSTLQKKPKSIVIFSDTILKALRMKKSVSLTDSWVSFLKAFSICQSKQLDQLQFQF